MINKQLRKEIRNYFNEMGIPNPYAATINMKTSDVITARKHIGFFRNRYERGIGRRNKSYFFIPVLEYEPHLHYHIILSRPEKLEHDEYVDIFKTAIGKTKQIQNDYNVIKPVTELKRWTGYITKFKNANDEIDWLNLRR